MQHEVQYEVSYFRAYDAAVKEAQAIAFAEGNDCGSAQISARAPNYPPAQLLYAYAIENVLKGIIVANNPRLIGGEKLNNALKSHDLFELAKDATVTVHVQEEPVMKALSQLSIWAGRYPVALHQREHMGAPNSDELLDYGSRNPVMRLFFDRTFKELESKLPKPLENCFDVVVVFRPPGT